MLTSQQAVFIDQVKTFFTTFPDTIPVLAAFILPDENGEWYPCMIAGGGDDEYEGELKDFICKLADDFVLTEKGDLADL